MGFRDYDQDKFFQPTNVEKLRKKVQEVAAAGGKVRVRGSQHADPKSVYTDKFDPVKGSPAGDPSVNVLLDQLLGFQQTDTEIVVGAGHHIGTDPSSLGPGRYPANTLVKKLDDAGLA